MISCIKLPEVTTLDPYIQSLRTRFTPSLVSSKRNVINTMPPEILGDIFLKLLEDNDMNLEHSTRPLVSRACQSDPLLFGHICSYWRNVALCTPKLWSRIYILKPQRSQVKLTRLWLERAGTHPLHLSIWAPSLEKFDQSAANDIMSLFMERSQYWMSISFSVGLQTLDTFSRFIKSKHSLELLESATLWVSKSRSKSGELDAIIDDIWRTIHACKTLKYVNWQSFYGQILPNHCPWNQLTGITLSSQASFDHILNVLSTTPQLEFLRAHIMSSCASDSSGVTPILSPVVHPRLKDFNLISNHETGPLFRLLSLPALRVLKIRNILQENTPRDMVGFQDFLKRSDPQHLVNFELQDVYLGEDDLRKYLTSPGFRNVLRIKLFNKNITDKVVNQLANIDEEGRHQVFPFLIMLHIGADWSQTTDGALSNMVTSRFSPINRRGNLKKVILSIDSVGPVDQLEFSKLFNQGLDGAIETGYVQLG